MELHSTANNGTNSKTFRTERLRQLTQTFDGGGSLERCGRRCG